MASLKSVEDISRELKQKKDEIKKVEQDIDNAKSDEERLQQAIRLNHLFDKEENLEKQRMFPLGFAPRSFSHCSPVLLGLFVFCASFRFFPSSGACAGKRCRGKCYQGKRSGWYGSGCGSQDSRYLVFARTWRAELVSANIRGKTGSRYSPHLCFRHRGNRTRYVFADRLLPVWVSRSICA